MMNFPKTRAFAALLVTMCLFCANFYAVAADWALPKVSVACVREASSHAAELGSQVVMGTPLQVVSDGDAWAEIVTPEGYRGYVIKNSLKMLSDAEFDAWRSADRVVVCSPDQSYIYRCSAPRPTERVSDVVNGAILRVDRGEAENGFLKVVLPDGRCGFIAESDVMPIAQWANRAPQMCQDDVILMGKTLMGVPYLWGGTSTKSIDCSGLVKVCYYNNGVILPRNASQQAKVGAPISVTTDDDGVIDFGKSDLSRGDLIFFGNQSTGRVNHVGIYLGDGRFLHCAGRVGINSLVPDTPGYLPLQFVSARRIDESTRCRLAASQHHWYFNM